MNRNVGDQALGVQVELEDGDGRVGGEKVTTAHGKLRAHRRCRLAQVAFAQRVGRRGRARTGGLCRAPGGLHDPGPEYIRVGQIHAVVATRDAAVTSPSHTGCEGKLYHTPPTAGTHFLVNSGAHVSLNPVSIGLIETSNKTFH